MLGSLSGSDTHIGGSAPCASRPGVSPGWGGSDTAAPAATVTVDQNNNDQNDQNDDNNQNNDNTNQTSAQQKAECLARNKGYPENCADIP